MWLEDCPVDLDYHLRRVQVPAPGGRRELDEVIGRIASTPLDRSRPLWEFHFAEGMADDRFALIGKVHHTLADGVASANLLARLMDLSGSAADENDEYPVCEAPSTAELLAVAGRDHVAHVAALPRLARDAARGISRLRRRTEERSDHPDLAKMFKTPPTFLNHVISPARTFATASLSLTEVKETSKQLGVTFNDIVLATAAGGLRELLLAVRRTRRPTADGVGAGQHRPVAGPGHRQRDRWPLGVVAHPHRRSARAGAAHVVVDRPREGKLRTPRTEAAGAADGVPAASLTPVLLRWQSKRAAHNKLMNVAVSSVPGPRERGHIGGAPVSEIYSIGVLSPGSAFNMTVWSYVDQVDISILSDDQTFNDIHEATDAMIHGSERDPCGRSDCRR